MVVRRKYSLPACSLIVEGLDEPNSTNGDSTRPLLSVLVSAECHIVGKPNALSGDRDFLDALQAAVSRYAQGLLGTGKTDVTSPDGRVAIAPGSNSLHHLSLRSSASDDPLQVDLTTLQLFDLVEVLDQLASDRRTLPDRPFTLAPRSRREANNEEPIAQRAAPLALGVSSLVVAGLLLSPLPVPEVERPREPEPTLDEVESDGDVDPASGLDAPPAGGDDPDDDAGDESSQSDADAVAEAIAPTAEEDLDNNTTDTDDETDESAAESPVPDPEPPVADLEVEVPDTTPEITDPDRLLALRENLYQEIDSAWTTEPEFDEDLVYRVSVGQDGAILGYRPQDDLAREFSDATPLSQLAYVPVEGGTADVEALAEYRVVFTENGVLQVSPWDGYPSEPADPPRIEDSATRDRLLFDLRDRLYDAWGDDPDPVFDRDLDYRLAVTEDGAIVRYEPLSSTASQYFGELPIEPLYEPSEGIAREGGQVALEPIAVYRVVFTPAGTIEIGPAQ